MSVLDMMNDHLRLEKVNGDIKLDVKSAVTPNYIMTACTDLQIETGDLLIRTLPNGLDEVFKVLVPTYLSGSDGIPSFYKITYKKEGIPDKKTEINHIVNNFHGSNARVNNNSTDNSTNIANTSDISEHIKMLRDEVQRLNGDSKSKSDALDIVDAIEGQFNAGKPSKVVLTTLLASLPPAGSIASIGSFLLSAIGG